MPEESKKPQFTPLTFETFLKAAEHAPGTGIFRSLIVKNEETGEVLDILKDGEYSCAFFISGLLALCKFLPEPCTTVASLEKQLTESEWIKIDSEKTKKGNIIIWEEIVFEDGSRNRHAGIAVSETEAVSTSYQTRVIVRHHITFGTNTNDEPKRRIESVFRYIGK